VPFPSSAQSLLSIFEVFNLNISGLSLPLSCIGLGTYWERLFFTLVFPLVIAAGIIVCSLVFAMCKTVRKGGMLAVAKEGAIQALENGGKSPLRVAGLIALPHLLKLSFLMFPMVSSAAFQAFACDDFDNGKSFLRADFAVECDTPEHDSLQGLAIIGILLYPVGISLLYSVLFLKAKRAILDEKPTALSSALGFLTLDFEKGWFAWELVEAWKKLFLVGFCVLVVPGTILQLIIAFVFSLLCMLLTAVAVPFVSDVDDTIGKAFGFALSSMFFFAVVIKVHVLTESVDDSLPQQLRKNFDLNSLVIATLMTTSVAIALAMTIVVVLQQCMQAAQTPVIKLRSSQRCPALTVADGITWHLFLSHIWSTGQDQCATIKRQLSLLIPGVSIFLDVDDLESIDALEEYIDGSQVIMIFVSAGYFKSANCLREVKAAVEKAKPLSLVFDPVRGGAPLDTIRDEECPAELRGIFTGRNVIEWHRIKDFQLVSLKLLAAEMLLACPGYTEEYTARDRSLVQDIYVPGEIIESPLSFKQPVRVYASPNNPGAREVAGVLQKAMAGLELSTAPPPTATHFLLYLSHDTFVGEAGERLAAEVRVMMTRDQPIVMLHENDMDNGGCEFARFFSTTPQDIIAGGLYKALALAYYPGPFRQVSLTLGAKKLGAVSKGGKRAWRSSSNVNAESVQEVSADAQASQVDKRLSSRI